MNIAQSEREALCQDLLEVGPDAPTLCEGWTTHDLLAHLWLRETDPIGAPGMFVKPLAGLTEKRMAELKTKTPFDELVAKLRTGPVTLSVFAIPGVDEAANAVEYFVHHEDVRRAGEPPQPPRELSAEAEALFWRRLKLMSRALFRKTPVGLQLENALDPDRERIKAAAGEEIVTIVGKPSEIVLFAFGRKDAADVELIGEPDAIAKVRAADLSL